MHLGEAVSSKHKIAFPLVKDADDYPPFDVEDLWGESTNIPLEFVIDNIPFFARQATLGDVIQASQLGGRLVFDKVIKRSPSSLMRVVMYDSSEIAEVRDQLKVLGCSSEWFAQSNVIAVDIPGSVGLQAVQEYLTELEEANRASYEEPILRHPEVD
ncbi:MAG: hypothetical protein JWO36_4459 [Myxococcales bacterium]|nr:hypothetical protein [Myxococcales bacterium]